MIKKKNDVVDDAEEVVSKIDADAKEATKNVENNSEKENQIAHVKDSSAKVIFKNNIKKFAKEQKSKKISDKETRDASDKLEKKVATSLDKSSSFLKNSLYALIVGFITLMISIFLIEFFAAWGIALAYNLIQSRNAASQNSYLIMSTSLSTGLMVLIFMKFHIYQTVDKCIQWLYNQFKNLFKKGK